MTTPVAPNRVLGTALLLLPATFLVWHTLGAVIAGPPAWLCGRILEFWLPEIVARTSLDGTVMLLQTTLGDGAGQLVPASETDNRLALQQDARLLTYGIPFFAALHFATPLDHPWERFARGLLALWLVSTVALVWVWLQHLLTALGAVTLGQAAGMPPAAAIGLAYQFAILMSPTVAPVLLWAAESRHLAWPAEYRAAIGQPEPETSRTDG